MAKISDYPKVAKLTQNNVLLLDGENGTKGIFASDLGKALLSLMTTKEIMDNINIADLEVASTLDGDSALIISTTDGNRRINLSDAVFSMLDPVISVENRRNTFRGKNLGSVYTDAQKAQVRAGTFNGLFLGDYWVIGGVTWRIVDFDYWWNCGDTVCTTHHLVIMPDTALYKAPMNDTDITEGGYVGSKMRRDGLNQAKTIANSAFGAANILNHREYLTNAVTNGYSSAGAWCDSTVELPNEPMMYGSYIFTPSGTGTIIVSRHTVSKSQLAGMKVSPTLINPCGENRWLRDVVSPYHFAIASQAGHASVTTASVDFGVRVVFGLVG